MGSIRETKRLAGQVARLPAGDAELEVWLRSLVRGADPRDLPAVLAWAEATASTRFPAEAVIAALRRALGTPI
jgi:hypothetical protein